MDAIARHSDGFAAAAAADLDAVVEHCPGWRIADLVDHLTEVHWFWATIVERQLSEPPEESLRPPRAEPGELIARFRERARHLVAVLRAADHDASVWTWAPTRHDVAFVARHQVQEAAVHHFDAAHAVGRSVDIEPGVAADAVEEFLTFSVSSSDDPAQPTRPSLAGRFALRCSDAPGAEWTILDDAEPGTIRFEPGVGQGLPVITAPASDLLLWLYNRVELDPDHVDAALLGRFRALCFTD